MIDVYNYFTIVIIISQYYCIVDQINTASWAFNKHLTNHKHLNGSVNALQNIQI